MALSLESLAPHGPVYGPAQGSRLAGVVVVHGGEGAGAGWSHRFAAILAAHGMLALPVARVQLTVGDAMQQAEVGPTDTAKTFTVDLPAGPVRLEAVMLDKQRAPLAEAYYVTGQYEKAYRAITHMASLAARYGQGITKEMVEEYNEQIRRCKRAWDSEKALNGEEDTELSPPDEKPVIDTSTSE